MEQNNKIKISIIMPVYNSGKYLSVAVESILNQSFNDFELILVDDGSTDGSSEMCDKYTQLDKRVVVIHQKNGGICKARNAALKIAKGEYIGFCDHDDEYLPGYLEKAYQVAIKYNADLIKVGKKELIIKGNSIIRAKNSNLPFHVYNREEIKNNYFKLVESDEMSCLWDALFKKSILDKYKITLNEYYKKGGEDIDFIQRYIRNVETFVTINGIYYNHYIRMGFSTSSKFDTIKIETIRKIFHEMIETIKTLGIDLNNKQFDYTYLLIRQYIGPVCALYSNPNYVASIKEKKRKIAAIKKEVFYLTSCNNQSIWRMFKLSKKYTLLYFLFRNNFYGTIIKLYTFRNK